MKREIHFRHILDTMTCKGTNIIQIVHEKYQRYISNMLLNMAHPKIQIGYSRYN